jgi:hypothetical protein
MEIAGLQAALANQGGLFNGDYTADQPDAFPHLKPS